jgi:hypothetical protein
MAKETIITEEMIIEQNIARSVNLWIRDNEESMYRYSIQLSRECDLLTPIREGLAKAKKFIEENKHRLPYVYRRGNGPTEVLGTGLAGTVTPGDSCLPTDQ